MKYMPFKTPFILFAFLPLFSIGQLPNYIPQEGLYGWWPFSGNANDQSSFANNGINNGATLTEDRFGNSESAYMFDGTDFIITTEDFPLLGSASRSINFWYKETSLTPDGTALSWGNNTPGTRFDCGVSSSWISAGASNSAIYYGHNESPENWNMYTIILQETINPIVENIQIYQNGVLLSNVLGTYNSDTPINTEITPLLFGRNDNNSAIGQSYLIGILDDVGIWNRAISTEEIIALFQAQNCTSNTSISAPLEAIQINSSISFIGNTSESNATYIWQSDFGQGFQTLVDYGIYSGTTTNTLTLSSVQIQNHMQQIKLITIAGDCIDTSSVAFIEIADTCITTLIDTIFVSVTDTLFINTTITNVNQLAVNNVIKVFPNPASTQLTIDYGNFQDLSGYTLIIVNSLGQTVFLETDISQQTTNIELSTWTGNGLYILKLLDQQNNIIENRKIVLQ